MKKMKNLIGILSITLLLFACGSNENPKNNEENNNMSANAGIVQEFTIKAVGNSMSAQSDDKMRFELLDVNEMNVKPGSKVKITLINEGTDPSMIHNIVFVKMNTRKEVALESVAAGPDNGFVAKGNSNVIAYSPMAQPGETVSFEFTAPKEGSYEYLCTYPGHSDMMKGWLYVE
tara:strand:+ start:769 stop:1293 length:525 start_codon:yes stop_codon:yes gene_type:complete